jgi:L-rhamnose mutarotase
MVAALLLLCEVQLPRVCFQLQVKAERVAEYRERHAAVWPDMRDALAATGWRNYSLYLSETGMVIGYLECDDFDEARRAMEQTDVNARWQADMGEFFEGLEGQRPDEGLRQLSEIFHLD